MGWRSSTIDIDLKMVPEQDELYRAIAELKESLEINIELAAPDQFIPPLPGWEERSRFILQAGRLSFYHYDFYSQALAKLERGHSRDVLDVAAMLDLELIDRERLLGYFDQIAPYLYRYPSLDAVTFRRAVENTVGKAR
ncbi:MAG: hypothetical protein M3Q09_03630 [Gemmatimonadota bacterium]|nr:hypothetical protein [Gemmatimonadota bacterium]